MADCPDCGGSATFNPKKDRIRQYSVSSTFGNFVSPLAEELRDPATLPLIFGVLPVVPFFDDSDATLRILRMMARLSPTQGSCIESIGDYVLGAGIKVIERHDIGMSQRDRQPVSDADAKAAIGFVKSWNRGSTTKYMFDQVAAIYDNMATFGNAGMLVTMSRYAGVKSVHYESVDAEKFRYLLPLIDPGYQTVAISTEWTVNYVNRYPPKVVSVYPQVEELEDGTLRTFIHLKNKKTGSDFYGLPMSYSSLYYQYMEYQLGAYSTKGYAEDWTGKVFFETVGDVAEDGQDTDIQEFREHLRETFTRQGKGRRIVHRHRNTGTEQTSVHEFKDDKSHEFHNSTSEISERKIIMSHDWHPDLLGVSSPGRLGNSDFRDIYMVKQATVIGPMQEWVMEPINELYQLAQMFLGSGPDVTLALDALFVFDEQAQVQQQNQQP